MHDLKCLPLGCILKVCEVDPGAGGIETKAATDFYGLTLCLGHAPSQDSL